MIEIIADQMQYIGGKIDNTLNAVKYSDIYYEEYTAIYNDCFRPMRSALELSPTCCDTRDQLIKKQSDISILIVGNDTGCLQSSDFYRV